MGRYTLRVEGVRGRVVSELIDRLAEVLDESAVILTPAIGLDQEKQALNLLFEVRAASAVEAVHRGMDELARALAIACSVPEAEAEASTDVQVDRLEVLAA